MDERVQKYLKEKYGENYEKDAEANLESAQSRNNIGRAFADLGDVFAGNKVGTSDAYFSDLNKQAKENTIGKIEADKKAFIDQALQKSQLDRAKREADMSDPKSQASANFRKGLASSIPRIVEAYGPDFENVSAADLENVLKPHQLREQIEARKEAARIAAGARRDAREARVDDKLRERMTTYGEARTNDDAKVLKNASDIKADFDSKLQEMIALREKHGGGAILNRDDVGRGKQLSKDLLLAYKDLSKLGVLSKADEAILNAIIPDDPLQYNSPLAAIQGQDPILHKMKKFKDDSERDFQSRLQNRLQNPGQVQKQKNVVKRQVNKETGQVRVVYDDGTFEIENSQARNGM